MSEHEKNLADFDLALLLFGLSVFHLSVNYFVVWSLAWLACHVL